MCKGPQGAPSDSAGFLRLLGFDTLAKSLARHHAAYRAAGKPIAFVLLGGKSPVAPPPGCPRRSIEIINRIEPKILLVL